MMSSLVLTGNELRSPVKPYVLAVASHKGGTGRTTAALALAWCWGQTGLRTTLLDADPVHAARLVAAGANGRCAWQGVQLLTEMPGQEDALPASDLVVIDCPSLTDREGQPVLPWADGIVLTTQAELLALRTTPAATRAVRAAQAIHPSLELVGLLLPMLDSADDLQMEMLAQLRSLHGDLLLEPPVPLRPELRDWPLQPGSPLPAGPGRQAYLNLVTTLTRRLGVRVSA